MLSNFRKGFRGTCIAAVGKFEASGKSKGNGLSAKTMRDVTADQVGEASGSANGGNPNQDESINTSLEERERLN